MRGRGLGGVRPAVVVAVAVATLALARLPPALGLDVKLGGNTAHIPSTPFSQHLGLRHFSLHANLTNHKHTDLCGVGEDDRAKLEGKVALAHALQPCFDSEIVVRLARVGCVGLVRLTPEPFVPGLFVFTSWRKGHGANVAVVDVATGDMGSVVEWLGGGADRQLEVTLDSSDLSADHFRDAFASMECFVLSGVVLVVVNVAGLLFALWSLFKRPSNYHPLTARRILDLPTLSVLLEALGCATRAVVCALDPFLTTGRIVYEAQVVLMDVTLPLSFFSSLALGVMMQRLLAMNASTLSRFQQVVLYGGGLGTFADTLLIALRPLYINALNAHIGERYNLVAIIYLVLDVSVAVFLVVSGQRFVVRYRHLTLWRWSDMFSLVKSTQPKREDRRNMRIVGLLLALCGAARAMVAAGLLILIITDRYTARLWLTAMNLMYYGVSFSSMSVCAVILFFGTLATRGSAHSPLVEAATPLGARPGDRPHVARRNSLDLVPQYREIGE